MTSYTAEEVLGVVGLFFVCIPAWSGLMLVWMPLGAVIFGASFASLATVVLLWVRAVFGVGPRLFWRAPRACSGAPPVSGAGGPGRM